MNKFLALLVTATATFASAQESVEQIVVTGTRTEHSLWDSPIATQILVIDEIKLQHYKNLAELLSSAPGVELIDGVRGQSLRLNGLDPKYTLVLIDGQRMSGKIGDAYDLQSIELDGIQRIEITRGAGSALYGSDAIAGVINIITQNKVRQSVRIHGDSNGQRDASITTGFQSGDFTAGANIFGNRSDPIHVPGSDATRISGSDKIGFQLIPRWQTSNWEVRSRIHVTQEKLDATEISAAGAVLKRENNLKNTSFTLEPTHYLFDGSQIAASVKQETNHDDYTQKVRRTGLSLADETTREDLLESNLSYTKPWNQHRFNLGVQWINESLRSDRLQKDSVSRERGALYLQDEISLLENGRLILVPAIRQDHDSQYDGHSSRKLALRFAIDSDQAVLVSYGEGYRAPSFKELYLLFENTSVGYVVQGNDQLKPESSRSSQVQYNLKSDNTWNLSISAFHNTIQRLIDTQLLGADGSGTQKYSYRNISAAEILGSDLYFAIDLSNQWSFNAAYGFLQARDLSQATALPGRSKHSLSYRIQYRVGAFRLAQLLKWQSSRAANDDADFSNKHAIVIGELNLSYRQDTSWLYSITIENLTANSGDDYWRIPPRSIGAAITWNPST